MNSLCFRIAVTLLLLVSFSRGVAHAQLPVLDATLKIDTVLYETRVFARLRRVVENDIQAAAKPVSDWSDAELTDFLQSHVETYLQDLVEERGVTPDPAAKDPVKLAKVSQTIRTSVVKLLHGVRAQGRKYGIGVAIGYAIVSVAEYVVPVWMVAIGQPEIAAALLIIPSATVFLTAAVAIESATTYLTKAKQFGGVREYRENQSLHRIARKTLGLKGASDSIARLSDAGMGIDLHSNAWTDALNAVGLDRQALTFHNISQFCKEQGVSGAQFAELKAVKSSKLSADAQTFLATLWVMRSLSQDQIFEFIGRFKKSFVFGLPQSDQDDALREWAQGAASIKSLDDLPRVFSGVPAGAKAGEVVHLYTDFVLPSLIDSIPQLKFHRFRTLLKATWSLFAQADAVTSIDEIWSASWQDRLVAATSVR